MSYRRGRHRSSNVRWNFLMSVDTVLGGITYFIPLYPKIIFLLGRLIWLLRLTRTGPIIRIKEVTSRANTLKATIRVSALVLTSCQTCLTFIYI